MKLSVSVRSERGSGSLEMLAMMAFVAGITTSFLAVPNLGQIFSDQKSLQLKAQSALMAKSFEVLTVSPTSGVEQLVDDDGAQQYAMDKVRLTLDKNGYPDADQSCVAMLQARSESCEPGSDSAIYVVGAEDLNCVVGGATAPPSEVIAQAEAQFQKAPLKTCSMFDVAWWNVAHNNWGLLPAKQQQVLVAQNLEDPEPPPPGPGHSGGELGGAMGSGSRSGGFEF